MSARADYPYLAQLSMGGPVVPEDEIERDAVFNELDQLRTRQSRICAKCGQSDWIFCATAPPILNL